MQGGASPRIDSLSAGLINDAEHGGPASLDLAPRDAGLLGHLHGPWRQAIRWYPAPIRPYRRRELLADAVVHALGIVLGVLGFVSLALHLAAAASWPRKLSVTVFVYAASLLAMLVCSATYNVGQVHWGAHRRWLELLDHTGICLLIAGTFTPVMAVACQLTGAFVLWGLMVSTVTAKAVGGRLDSIVLHVASFVLGPVVTVAIVWHGVINRLDGWEMILIVAGGACYILGLVPWGCRRLEGHVAIWHVCVLLGSGCFFAIVQHRIFTPADVARSEADLGVCWDGWWPGGATA